MLSHKQKAGLALILSCMSTLIAVYLDSLEFEEIGFDNPWIFSTNMLWVLVVLWLIWDLFRGKNIQQSLILTGAVMLASLIWDSYRFGFGLAQLFYTLELLLFASAYWFSGKSTAAKRMDN
ncbi:hypothetical protein [Undibacterium flavidum]|uniref:Nicotinamide mononucleotide transporter n=1 Tax=Undibacterium flavidum TaxID=2762297 RepID=A0ABR6YH44_9BURK|nr:hypothetical protein [Undibacterium flavidum]MBC3875895.1 hypothetical protein [Undibacterium flavidum]